MKHRGTQVIETNRLILRSFNLNDAQMMYNNWASEDEVTKFLTWPTHSNVEITKTVLQSWINEYEKDSYYQWAIVLKDINEPIGCIGVNNVIDNQIKMAHIGYCLGSKWWHQRIMSESLHAVIDYLFDEVGVNRIESRFDPNNTNSGKVMKKCGMKYEGTLRQSDRNNQGICDASYYGLLASERK